jgi:hypothetical protein
LNLDRAVGRLHEITRMRLEEIALVLGILFAGIGLLMTALGLFYTARQLRLSRFVAQAESYLHLDELLLQHKSVYLKLSPDPEGEWGDQVTGPETVEEWGDVVLYMGLFERIKILIDLGVLDLAVIKRLYSYRIQDIVNNKVIYQWLCIEHAYDWQDFIELCRVLSIKPQEAAEIKALRPTPASTGRHRSAAPHG